MGALTNARDTTEIMNGGKQLVLPVKAKTTIYQGPWSPWTRTATLSPGRRRRA